MAVTLIANTKVPLTHIQMNFYGSRHLEKAGKRGLAAFTSHMLTEGTTSKSALEISAALQTLASRVTFRSYLEYAALDVETLDDKLDETLSLASDMLQNPAFNPSDIERVRRNTQNAILTERDDLKQTADKVFRKVLFGDQYLGSWSRGSNETVESLTREDLVWWHGYQWRLSNAGLVVVSGLPKDVILKSLNRAFGAAINHSKAVPLAEAPKPQGAHDSKAIYWVQKDGASQSVVMLGNIAPAFDPARSTAQQAGNSVLGGQFTSRVNMNLREDKGYTYGARSAVNTYRHGGYYRASASVKANTTAASLTEFLKEFDGITGAHPITETEYQNTCSRMLQGWPAYFERGRGMLSQYAAADANKRPTGWLEGYEGRVTKLSHDGVQKALGDLIDPSKLAIVIVGDWAIAGADVEALKLGPIVRLDHDGNPAKATPEG
jgi:zinc protease